MTTLVGLICAVSIAFFIVFLVACSLPPSGVRRRKQKAAAVHKFPESLAVDSACGRRVFVHLEEQMAEFLSVHGRTAGMLLVLLAAAPLTMAQSQSDSSSQTASADQSIPPAVAKQLEEMQKRIDQLEQQLQQRQAPAPTADGV